MLKILIVKPQVVLKAILDHSLISCGHCIHGAIAQRVLEQSFSRLSQRSGAGSEWQGGEEVIMGLSVSNLQKYRSLPHHLIGSLRIIGIPIEWHQTPGFANGPRPLSVPTSDGCRVREAIILPPPSDDILGPVERISRRISRRSNSHPPCDTNE